MNDVTITYQQWLAYLLMLRSSKKFLGTLFFFALVYGIYYSTAKIWFYYSFFAGIIWKYAVSWYHSYNYKLKYQSINLYTYRERHRFTESMQELIETDLEMMVSKWFLCFFLETLPLEVSIFQTVGRRWSVYEGNISS